MKEASKKETRLWYFPSEGTPLVIPQKPNLLEKVSIVFGVLILCVFLLVVGPQGYGNITEFKFWTFAGLTAAYVIGIFLCWLSYVLSTSARKQSPEFRVTLPQIILFSYLLIVILSAILSPYDYDVWIGGGRFEGLLSVLLYVTVFLLFSFFGMYSGWYIRGFAISGILFSLIAIPQLMGINFLSFFPEGVAGYPTTPFLTTVGNIDMVSGFMALAVPAIACAYILLKDKYFCPVFLVSLILLLFVQLNADVDSGKVGMLAATVVMLPILAINQERISRILTVCSAICCSFALHFIIPITYADEVYSVDFALNRMGLLFIAAGLLSLALSMFLQKKKGLITLSPKVLRIIIVSFLLLAIIAGVLFLYNYQGNNSVLAPAHDILHGTLSDDAGSGRGIVWKNSIKIIGEMPLIGSGPDSFVFRYMSYNDEASDVYFDFAHNDFLQIGVNYGLIGLLLYLAFLVSLAVRMFRVVDRNPLVCIFTASIAGYLVHSFFSFSITIITPLFWVMAGLLDHCIRQTQTTETGEIALKKKMCK